MGKNKEREVVMETKRVEHFKKARVINNIKPCREFQ
jgi:hypothetical protein